MPDNCTESSQNKGFRKQWHAFDDKGRLVHTGAQASCVDSQTVTIFTPSLV